MKDFGRWFSESNPPSQTQVAKPAAERTPLEAAAHKAWIALSECVDNLYAPDPECRCHLSPPCNDCVEHSGTRQALADAHEAIAALKKELAP